MDQVPPNWRAGLKRRSKVFSLCGGQEYDPPDEPQADWLPLEKHDRRYQIAASYFYHGQYLEAAARFEEIGRTPDSPWRDLGRYLVPRSLVREATVNEKGGRVAPGDCSPEALTRSGQGDFHHPAPPLMCLVATPPISAQQPAGGEAGSVPTIG